MEDMEPMFFAKVFPGNKHPKAGKYSFNEEKRSEIFSSLSMKSGNIRIVVWPFAKNLKMFGLMWALICPAAVVSCQLDYAEMPLN